MWMQQAMIHKPLCMAYGNADDFKAVIKQLNLCEDSILDVYMEHVQEGVTRDKIQSLMSNETWFDSKKMQQYFNVEIEEKAAVAACASDFFEKYNNIPETLKGIDTKDIVDAVIAELENRNNAAAEAEKQRIEEEKQQMGNVSYSAHISNGKSAITSKSKLLGVAKHNLRKYKSPEYSSDNILLLRGTEDLYQDVKNVYHQEFDEAVQQYNQKQKRADRRIEDYFEHVANLNQDMAVEIIFQCGDKEFWEEHTDKKEKMYNVYAYLLSTMERFLPNFKVANAVIHFDEASPHMHVVGVPVWEGAKKGLAKKVSKRNVFTPESLSVILQDKLREEAGSCFKFNVKEELAEKKLGRNHDLSVMEYKVVKETERLEELQEQVKDSDLDLFAKKLAYKEVSKTQKEKLDEINKDISSKEAQAEELDYQITIMKSQLYEYEEEASKLEKFKESLSNLKQYIASYMPLSPLIEEYANAVEGKREIQAGNSFRGLLTALGELLNSFKELIVDGICWFPRLMRWQTSKGEVAPVFSDYRNEGYNYRLVAYQNLVTKEQYSVESVQEEIKAENRVGTLEQLERRIEETEVLVRKLHKDKMR